MNYLTVDIGEPVIAAAVTVGQLLVIESHLIENGRVQVVDVDTVLDGRAAEHISGAVAVAGFHAATSHPDGEAVVIVVAAVFTLGSWCAAKLTTPDNERLIEEATGLEIF